MNAPAPARTQSEVTSSRLLLTLGATGAVAGLAIVFVFRATQPTIQRYKAEQLALAVREVLKQPDRFDTLYVVDGELKRDNDEAVSGAVEQIFVGYRGNEQVGFAIVADEPGFQDVIRLIFGYEPVTQKLLGMRVLESRETPGLGDKIEKDKSFVEGFDGVTQPLVGVGSRDATGEAHEVDMITGATISSRAVIRAINNALERYAPMVEQYLGGPR